VRRADRLFQIIELLRRRRRAVRAEDIADTLGVSVRTIYRDISDLSLSGVPIRGEAGVGYVLSKGYDLPPLMFDQDELEALVLGARIVQSRGDAGLARAAETLLAKVEAVVPERARARLETAAFHAFDFRTSAQAKETLGHLRLAIRERRRIRFAYTDRQAEATERTVMPLGLFFWQSSWTVAAWCELRSDFRSFRIDRIEELELLDDVFEIEPGRSLQDLFERYEEG
jgi:predicted DNA-binding transcriptional regulator YafY